MSYKEYKKQVELLKVNLSNIGVDVECSKTFKKFNISKSDIKKLVSNWENINYKTYLEDVLYQQILILNIMFAGDETVDELVRGSGICDEFGDEFLLYDFDDLPVNVNIHRLQTLINM